jgi:hypothetical protein
MDSARRKFATELKQTNLKDLCALGGSKGAQTLLTCYVAPDEGTQREALAQRRRSDLGRGFRINGHRERTPGGDARARRQDRSPE